MRKLFLVSMAVVLAGCAGSRPDAVSPQSTDAPSYTSQGGDIPVGVIPAGMLRDAQRNKDIDVSIDYPTRGGPHPVVIFSHAYGLSGRGYVFLSSYWASNGYVVIRPTHADATPGGSRDISEEWTNQGPAQWRDRVRDIKFVIDSLGALEQQYPELQGKMDHNRIGVGGHSYGAFTALLLAGMRTFSGGVATSYVDPRVKAVIAMSPQGPGESRGLTRESYADIRIPVLFLTGTSDRGTSDTENAAWRRLAFELSPAGDKWFVSLTGANHFTFAGRNAPPPNVQPTTVPPLGQTDPRTGRPVPSSQMQPQGASTMNSSTFLRERGLFNVVRTVTLALWDTHLKTEPRGREYLTKLSTRGDVTVETK
ncbi:MAG: alpha/beta fold hydrolase [Thermoanaerobaculia bacterium]